MDTNQYRKLTKDELMQERCRVSFQAAWKNALRDVMINSDKNKCDFEDLFPVERTERILVGTKTYDLTAYLSVKRIGEE